MQILNSESARIRNSYIKELGNEHCRVIRVLQAGGIGDGKPQTLKPFVPTFAAQFFLDLTL
jgi:hypothetical protein